MTPWTDNDRPRLLVHRHRRPAQPAAPGRYRDGIARACCNRASLSSTGLPGVPERRDRHAAFRRAAGLVPAAHGWVDRTRAYARRGRSAVSRCGRAGAGPGGAAGGPGGHHRHRILDRDRDADAGGTDRARHGLRADAMRVPVFGLGCAGACRVCPSPPTWRRARPGAVVLMVAVETCTVLFAWTGWPRPTSSPPRCSATGPRRSSCARATRPTMRAPGSDGAASTCGPTPGHQGWTVEETGLGVVFDRSIPALPRRTADGAGRPDPGSSVDRHVCHPGGAKVITALETTLSLPEGSLDVERRVLAQNGNMSAPTVLFVLEQVLRAGTRGSLLAMALGPGFTLSVLPITVQ